MKRKIIGILLFLCFLAPIATTYFFLQKHKKHIKKEIKSMLHAGTHEEKLVLLKFTGAEKKLLNWHHSKEFEYREEMYDIVKTQVKDDTTFYWCWWDQKETELSRQLDELVAIALGNNSKRQENQSRLIIFFKSLFFTEPAIKNTADILEFKEIFTYIPDHYQSISNSPPVPPPRYL